MAREKLKEKKTRTTPTNTSLLPPCKVCLEPAAGFHYGVNTCEACKGFFRRSLLREKPYKCLGSGNCNIQAGKRHICPKCRHRKCLAVGMSKEAIKTGRYTHAKRTQDILEYQEMMKKSLVDSPLSTSSAATPFSIHSSSCSRDSSTPGSPKVNNCSPTSDTSPLMDFTDASLISFSTEESVASILDGPLELTVPSSLPFIPINVFGETGRAVDASSSSLSSASASASASDVSIFSGFSSSQSLEKPLSASQSEVIPSLERSRSWSDTDLSQCVQRSSVGLVTDSSPFLEEKNLSSNTSLSLSTEFSHLNWEAPEEACSLPGERREEDLSDEECARIVHHLLRSHDNISMMPSDRLSDKELLAKQMACFEACKAKAELFHCKPLSKEEYLDIYTKTGLDIDNRQWLMGQHLVPVLDQTIRKYIAFCKTIPGFTQLSLTDQINLIKNNRCEFRMLCTFRNYNYQLKVMTLESGSTICFHEMAKILDTHTVLQRFDCAHTIRKLGLSRDEAVLLQSLLVVTVGEEDMEESDKVSIIQWRIAQCLLWLLRQNRPDPNRMFAHIISKMCYIRELSVGFYTWLKSNPVHLFKPLQENALMAEWFSSV
ncbi:uncharacterized protein LOC143286817 isoform X2 [Babylonia areolata]